jgi:uncharacterized membrane protein
MEGIVVFGLVVLALFIAGSICGIIALVKQRNLKTRLQTLENNLSLFRTQEPATEKPPAASVEEEVVSVPAPETLETPPTPPEPPPLPPQALIADREMKAPPAQKDRLSLEMKLGTRWLNWVGIVMLLVGIAFFLKYAYDNAWIGPKGRLALGTLFGITALLIGERFRRKDWDILFKVLSGGGLASFYLCIFFSFQIYNLSSQTVSMLLAILVTGLAVVMAVAHNAMSIAILALIGGFSSPVLLSTGQNHVSRVRCCFQPDKITPTHFLAILPFWTWWPWGRPTFADGGLWICSALSAPLFCIWAGTTSSTPGIR